MAVELDVIYEVEAENLPSAEQFQRWVETALRQAQGDVSLCIQLVDSEDSQALNRDYRGKDKPTNVLSFPSEIPDFVQLEQQPLGDLAICVEVVEREAQEQHKPVEHHWAHMVIHGCLHLLGYDHIEDEEAEQMEALERELLATLDIADPYLVKGE